MRVQTRSEGKRRAHFVVFLLSAGDKTNSLEPKLFFIKDFEKAR